MLSSCIYSYEIFMCNFCLYTVFVWFGYQSNTASLNELLFPSIFSRRDYVQLVLLFKSFKNFPVKSDGPADFFFRKF